MQYMLLIYLDEQGLSEAERETCYLDSAQFAHELNAKGQYLAAAPLHPTSTATSVRLRDGKRLVVMPQKEPAGGSVHVTFLLNFFDEVRRRVK